MTNKILIAVMFVLMMAAGPVLAVTPGLRLETAAIQASRKMGQQPKMSAIATSANTTFQRLLHSA